MKSKYYKVEKGGQGGQRIQDKGFNTRQYIGRQRNTEMTQERTSLFGLYQLGQLFLDLLQVTEEDIELGPLHVDGGGAHLAVLSRCQL